MVATATTVLYPTPPTANKLDSNQRVRLIRSTRKLGQILGTTPHLLEPSLPITLLPVGNKKSVSAKISKRERSVVAHSASSSTSSLESCSSASSTTSFTTPLASSDVFPESRPSFPDSKPSRSANASRPLYIRLNVVPVSPSDSRFDTSLPPTTARSPATSPSTSLPPTPCTPTFNQSEVRRKRMAKLTRHLGESIPPQLVSSSSRKRRSMSVSTPGTASQLAFSQHKPAVSYYPLPSAVDRQASWIGEWNRDDMEDVQKQLRALKGR